MPYDFFSVIELCGIAGVAFWFVGFCMLVAGVRRTRRTFREKGYLKPPSGRGWLRFLLWRQYDHFEDPGTRFYFGIAHSCLIGMLIVLVAVVILFGSYQLFGSMSGLPGGGMPVMPEPTLPK